MQNSMLFARDKVIAMSMHPGSAHRPNRLDRSTTDRTYTPADEQARVYDRAQDLPKLLPIWPWEVRTVNRAGHLRLLATLRIALRAERQRGLAGHWAYDLARHAQLVRAYRAETAAYLRSSDKQARNRAAGHDRRRCARCASP